MDDEAQLGMELVHRFQLLQSKAGTALHGGQYGQAEGYFEHAVELARLFVQQRPDVDTVSALASSLSGLAVSLQKLGADPEALPVLEELVELYRELTGLIPADAEPALASTLIALAETYRGPSFYVDFERSPMLEVSKMKAYRRDRMARGAWDGPVMTMVDPEKQAQAEAPLREAIPLLRRLTRTNREEFEPSLALVLNLFGETLITTGRESEAEAPLREAEAMYRKLVSERPIFSSLLTDTLSLLSRVPTSGAGGSDRMSVLEELLPGLRSEASLTEDERENGMSLAKSGARDRLMKALGELADLYKEAGREHDYRAVWDRELGALMGEVRKVRWDR